MNKHKRKNRIFILSVIVILSVSLISFKILDDGDDFEIAKSFDIFHNAVREIRLFYVDDTDISKLINDGTQEFLKKLDPYTVYYPESKIEDFTFMTTGAYGGIGAMISERGNTLLITDVYKGSPADISFLKTGDVITEINNIIINKNNISEVREMLKGEPGSEISLTIKRYGYESPIKKIIKREKIEFANIPFADVTDKNIAYIKLNQFKQKAASDFKNKLSELIEKNDIKGLIIDLRGNPGGLLSEAVNIVSLFVKKGSEIVSTKGRIKDWNHVYKAVRDPIYPNLPIVVLMNSGSASASEIVAGAMQDLDRGIIIGQGSYGKGLVQITRKMNYNTRIKLTTAKYYIPSGRCIQAIDYSTQNPDGSVGYIPDSLISKFKTLNGRTVRDGGGIKPDIRIEFDSVSNFTKELLINNVIFDFVTKYYYENKKIASADIFEINDDLYLQFSEYVLNSTIEFKSKCNSKIDDLLLTAKDEKYNEEILQKIENLKSDLLIDKKKALELYKDQIISILDMSIVSRYYYEEGKIISYMKYDDELKEAILILKDTDRYNSILSSIND
ncbi:MAG: PDZ domain-containing protein [Bacteroidales bacterium]|nr:PDZ domain-containing protein [Bacteroidales bacterium]